MENNMPELYLFKSTLQHWNKDGIMWESKMIYRFWPIKGDFYASWKKSPDMNNLYIFYDNQTAKKRR